jgi:hypothetical protein
VLGSHVSRPRSPRRVHTRRWYRHGNAYDHRATSHGNAFDHRETRATARPSAAQPTYSLIKRH